MVCALGASLLAFTGHSAHATVVTYSDAAAFQAAAPDATQYSFPYPTTNDFVDRPCIDGPLGFSTFDHFTACSWKTIGSMDPSYPTCPRSSPSALR